MSSPKYESIFEQYKVYYPYDYQHVVEWWESGPMSIFIKYDDGTICEYNHYDNSRRNIIDDDIHDPSAKSIGYNLKKLIQMSGMTQIEIAEKIGVTVAMMTRYVHGQSMPSADKIYKIAKVLDCSIDELFDGYYLNRKEG